MTRDNPEQALQSPSAATNTQHTKTTSVS